MDFVEVQKGSDSKCLIILLCRRTAMDSIYISYRVIDNLLKLVEK